MSTVFSTTWHRMKDEAKMGPSLDTIEGGTVWARGPLPCLLHLDQAHAHLVPHTPHLHPKPPFKVDGWADSTLQQPPGI